LDHVFRCVFQVLNWAMSTQVDTTSGRFGASDAFHAVQEWRGQDYQGQLPRRTCPPHFNRLKFERAKASGKHSVETAISENVSRTPP
jgi:hypothetical protein